MRYVVFCKDMRQKDFRIAGIEAANEKEAEKKVKANFDYSSIEAVVPEREAGNKTLEEINRNKDFLKN